MKPAVIRSLQWLLTLSIVLALTVTASAGQSVEIRQKDGSRWRGAIGDQVTVTFVQLGVTQELKGTLEKVEDSYIIVEGRIAGKSSNKLIYKGNIVTVDSSATNAATPDRKPEAKAKSSVEPAEVGRNPLKSQPTNSPDEPGVFVLPLEGGVGESFRHNEIDMIGEYADKFGPGQIIVLIINSNGGLVLEEERVCDSIERLKKRHRVIAWIQKAISAGAMTAMACDEVYFMTEGTCGSVTTINGALQSIPEEQIKEQIQEFADMAERNGYSRFIALAMKLNKYMCSYDKDPETGVVTFYGDKSGKYLLSDENSNLCFNSSNALDCGFSDGTADTPEDLAKLLNLPRWNEKSDYGRKIAADWQRTVETAQKDIPRLLTRLNYWKQGTGDPVQIIGGQIQILNELIQWCDRAELITLFSFNLDKAQLQRQVEELRKQLADMRRSMGR